MTGIDKVVASINSLGKSRVSLWLIDKFGASLGCETIDEWNVKYVSFWGKNYTIASPTSDTAPKRIERESGGV